MMSRDLQAEDAPIRAILNAMDALEFIAQSRQGVGVRELARILRLTPATASRVVASLQASDMLDQDPDTARYHLGPRALKIAADHSRSINLHGVAESYLRDLVDATGETIFLGVLDGAEVVVINRIDSPQPLRMAGELGTREPAHCTALGKIMLASKPTHERADLVAHLALEPGAGNRVMTREALEAVLEETAGRGWALDDEEHFEGVRCVAAGIVNSEGRTIAAISVSGPAVRMTDAKIAATVPTLRAMAAAISRRLGYRPADAVNAPR
ncbi:IclR family transcriptional regulator [Nitratireductor alexandrii]|uniref:IclR family transcriptional regulator n=1 Tax=Nitratireductor alexandrii TaxID=2448161 RepID=UPI000FD86E48|nr:IclR family transcriptional regulator [Nitratireductor alexandrii]